MKVLIDALIGLLVAGVVPYALMASAAMFIKMDASLWDIGLWPAEHRAVLFALSFFCWLGMMFLYVRDAQR